MNKAILGRTVVLLLLFVTILVVALLGSGGEAQQKEVARQIEPEGEVLQKEVARQTEPEGEVQQKEVARQTEPQEEADMEQEEAAMEQEEADMEQEKADMEQEKADMEQEEADMEQEEADVELAKVLMVHRVEEYKHIVAEFFEDLVPYMQRGTPPMHSEYLLFAKQFRENREKAARLRPMFRHISAAMVTTGIQLSRKQNGQRADLQESIVIPFEEVKDELLWSLRQHFQVPEGPPYRSQLADGGCKEDSIFCLSKPWLSLAIALETDFVCLWDSDEGWANDYERLLDFDVLMILDYHRKDIDVTLDILNDIDYKGSIYLMPSESSVLTHAVTLAQLSIPGVCPVLLDNYWSIKDDIRVNTSFYPLWFKYPLIPWELLDTMPVDDNAWQRKEVFVARVTGRRSESDRYLEDRRAAAAFLSEMGYSVNDEDTRLSTHQYYEYFGRCKYAFLPMVERNSTGQIIADALVSSNFTILPFSYGHKLWMRALPPFLTIHNVAELQEKIEYLDSHESAYRSLLADVQAYAPPFMDQALGETAAEVVAAISLAPASAYSGVDLSSCLQLPVTVKSGKT